MSQMHLDEEQLQRYALNEFTDEAAAEHIAACTHCRMQTDAYRMLYSHIREAEVPLPGLNPTQLIPDFLPDQREPRFLYYLLFGALALFTGILIGCWGMISWIFQGLTSIVFVLGLLLLLALLTMQLMELINAYRKKAEALNLE